MNQNQNNINNFDTQNNKGLSNNQTLNNSFNSNMQQSNQSTFNTQPVNQQPIQQPVNSFDNNNYISKPPKKNILGLIIGVLVVVVIAVVIVAIFVLQNNKGGSGSSNSIFDSGNKYIDGKIPYNKEINECAKEFVKYKDNTRNLCYQQPIYYNAEDYYDRDYARYIDFSFYLTTDEKNVLSFKLTEDTKEYYNFLEMGLDDDNSGYVYLFQTLEEDTLVFVSSQSLSKSKTLDLTNKQVVKTSDNKELYKGVYAEKYPAYEFYTEIDGIKVAITVVNQNYSVDEAYSRIQKFISKLSKDNGSPFIVDYAINENMMGIESDLTQTYFIKDYKYVGELKYYKSTGSSVKGKTGLNLTLKNNGITYRYGDTYLLKTDDYNTYTTYRTELGVGTAKYGMWSSYIPEDNVYTILINVWGNTDIISRFGFVVDNPDMSKGYQYYIDNFSEMLTNSNGTSAGATEEFHG